TLELRPDGTFAEETRLARKVLPGRAGRTTEFAYTHGTGTFTQSEKETFAHGALLDHDVLIPSRKSVLKVAQDKISSYSGTKGTYIVRGDEIDLAFADKPRISPPLKQVITARLTKDGLAYDRVTINRFDAYTKSLYRKTVDLSQHKLPI